MNKTITFEGATGFASATSCRKEHWQSQWHTFRLILLFTTLNLFCCIPIIAAEPRVTANSFKANTDKAVALQKSLDQQTAEVKKLLTDDLKMIVESPFVIAGNMNEKSLQLWHKQTIEPAMTALGNQYFTHKPDAPITVWLFKDTDSYNKHALRIFGDKDVSVYGYFKPDKRALVMNIGTGGGTLVHELTHALAAFDFPGQPDWFNEGLASLYEASSFQGEGKNLRITGHVNWRLPKLQETIRKEKLQSLGQLMTMRDFRGANVGINYAQARYFCMYLQEKGKLQEYYREFNANRLTDPHGVEAAVTVLGKEAWKTIDADYQKWVLTLKQ